MTFTAEIDRLKREIKTLQDLIEEHGAGRYVRALQARMRDYGNLVRRYAEIQLAKPLPRAELRGPYLDGMRLTLDERAWLEGRADCPLFKGRETELAAMRAEHWQERSAA